MTETASSALPQVVLPNVLLVLALGLAKGHLLASNSDALWLSVRILGLASVVVALGAFVNGQWKRKAIEVRMLCLTHSTFAYISPSGPLQGLHHSYFHYDSFPYLLPCLECLHLGEFADFDDHNFEYSTELLQGYRVHLSVLHMDEIPTGNIRGMARIYHAELISDGSVETFDFICARRPFIRTDSGHHVLYRQCCKRHSGICCDWLGMSLFQRVGAYTRRPPAHAGLFCGGRSHHHRGIPHVSGSIPL